MHAREHAGAYTQRMSDTRVAVYVHQENYLSLEDTGIGWIVLLLLFEGVVLFLVLHWRGSRVLPLPWGRWLGCLLPQEPILTLRRNLRARDKPSDPDVETERWRVETNVRVPVCRVL